MTKLPAPAEGFVWKEREELCRYGYTVYTQYQLEDINRLIDMLLNMLIDVLHRYGCI